MTTGTRPKYIFLPLDTEQWVEDPLHQGAFVENHISFEEHSRLQWHALSVSADILAIQRRRHSVNWLLQGDEPGGDVRARENVVRNLGDSSLLPAEVLVWKCVIADADGLAHTNESD